MHRPALRASLPFALVAILAIAVRESFVLRSGGLHSSYGYDTSVYYAAADALLHGRVPYSDFVLLHPPMVMLGLTPAALVGHLTTDRYGFALGSAMFAALGGVNAALVGVTARRWGFPQRAALAGALFYAVWFGAASAEFSSRLEPLGNFFLLVALAALGGRSLTRRGVVLAGVALALAASTKIWFVVPAVGVVVWLLATKKRDRVVPFGIGFLVAAIVVDGPFLVLSRGAMFSRVVLDQFGRNANQGSPFHRWSQLASVGHLPHGGGGLLAVFFAVAVILFVGVTLLAWRDPRGRFFASLAVAHVVVLTVSPSWFGFYADYAAVPFALAVGAAAASLRRRRAGQTTAWTTVAGAAAVSLAILVAGNFHAATPWRHSKALIAAVRGDRCVMSDAPAGLIELNKLDSDFANGCPNWVDFTGRTYFGRDFSSTAPRKRNAAWQHDMLAYLTSGQAVFVVRASGDGLARQTRAALIRGGVLMNDGSGALYSTVDKPRLEPSS